jgi:hypothetical protein
VHKGENELIIFEIGEIDKVRGMSFDDVPQLDTCHLPEEKND